MLKRDLSRIKTTKESLKEILLLIKYAHSCKRGEHSSSYKQYISLIKKHKLKYIILKNRKQVNSFLNKII